MLNINLRKQFLLCTTRPTFLKGFNQTFPEALSSRPCILTHILSVFYNSNISGRLIALCYIYQLNHIVAFVDGSYCTMYACTGGFKAFKILPLHEILKKKKQNYGILPWYIADLFTLNFFFSFLRK